MNVTISNIYYTFCDSFILLYLHVLKEQNIFTQSELNEVSSSVKFCVGYFKQSLWFYWGPIKIYLVRQEHNKLFVLWTRVAVICRCKVLLPFKERPDIRQSMNFAVKCVSVSVYVCVSCLCQTSVSVSLNILAYFRCKMTKCCTTDVMFVTSHLESLHFFFFFTVNFFWVYVCVCVYRKQDVAMLSSSWLCTGVQSVCLWLWLPYCQSSSSRWWASWRLERYSPYLGYILVLH